MTDTSREAIERIKARWADDIKLLESDPSLVYEDPDGSWTKVDDVRVLLSALQPQPVEVGNYTCDPEVASIRQRADKRWPDLRLGWTVSRNYLNASCDVYKMLGIYDRLAQDRKYLHDLWTQARTEADQGAERIEDLEETIARLQQQLSELTADHALNVAACNDKDLEIERLKQQIAEMQPRKVKTPDSIYELRIIRDDLSRWAPIFHKVPATDVLFEYIEQLETELARWSGTHHAWKAELERVKAERDALETKAEDWLKQSVAWFDRLNASRAQCERLRYALQATMAAIKDSIASGKNINHHDYTGVGIQANAALAAAQKSSQETQSGEDR